MKLKQHFSLVLIISLFPLLSSGQEKFSISGTITDSSTGETIIGATVFEESTGAGARTNTYGFYSLSLPAGKDYKIRVTYLGYETKYVNTSDAVNNKLDIKIEVKAKQLGNVVVSSKRSDANVQSTQMGTIDLSIEKVKTLPAFFGEVDMLKTLQLMPGVQSAGEGSSGFYVRGGGPDQNLILLDDAVVYNTGHLFGFFSVFNADALKNTTLIKGSLPANYGGRLSSVVDVTMKDGNNQDYKVKGGIGLLASRLSIEGPIQKGTSSFILSGRRTYVDVLSKIALSGVENDQVLDQVPYYFYDFNAKMNYKIGDKDKLFLSGYFGQDVFDFQSNTGSFGARIPWGNATGTLRWNHIINNRMFINTTFLLNSYNFEFAGSAQDVTFGLRSGVRDKSVKSDWEYYTKADHTIKAGINYTYHKFIPNVVFGEAEGQVFEPDQNLYKFSHDFSAYALDEFDLGDKVRMNIGLRWGTFISVGPFTDYVYSNNVPVDSTVYGKGEKLKTYSGFEPRFQSRIQLNQSSSLKLGATRTYQYMHLVSNNGSTLPTDLWVPSGLHIEPQKAWQYSAGYFKNFKDNLWETSVEVYYKDMQNQLEYRNGYTPNTSRDIVYEFVKGKGWSYGAEFYVNKSRGKWTGWIGYTLSWTKRQFPDLNDGEVYYARYDRRNDLSIVNSYEINDRWTVSAVFVYGSGSAITLPTRLYIWGDEIVQDYSDINAYRLPNYHRLDISAILKPKKKLFNKVDNSWAFSIYNVYNRQNPYIIYMDTEGSPNSPTGVDIKVKQLSILPILPSVTWNFEF